VLPIFTLPVVSWTYILVILAVCNSKGELELTLFENKFPEIFRSPVMFVGPSAAAAADRKLEK